MSIDRIIYMDIGIEIMSCVWIIIIIWVVDGVVLGWGIIRREIRRKVVFMGEVVWGGMIVILLMVVWVRICDVG